MAMRDCYSRVEISRALVVLLSALGIWMVRGTGNQNDRACNSWLGGTMVAPSLLDILLGILLR